MYMFPPQNPDLKPERMWNYEIAYSWAAMRAAHLRRINLFYIDGENLMLRRAARGDDAAGT